ncbi:MAG: ABC transporter permease subunit [Clostridia bacterium]
MLNEVRCSIFKRVIQTVSYLPYFLSWISVVGLVQTILGLYGPVNDLLALFGGSNFERILFLGQQKYFIPTYLILNLWKGTGWGTVIYLAAISGIDMQLYEAATIDGANKLQQIWHITLPAIRQTAILLLIMSIGGLFGSNFELVCALQNPYIDFEVISTAVYKDRFAAGRLSPRHRSKLDSRANRICAGGYGQLYIQESHGRRTLVGQARRERGG